MKRSKSTTFNYYKRFKPLDGNRVIARDHLPNTAANLIATSTTATLSDDQDTQDMEYGVGAYVDTEEWSAGERYGYPRYTSIWAPD